MESGYDTVEQEIIMSKKTNDRKKLFETSEIVTSDAEHFFTLPKPSEFFRECQGGCSDGKRYYYQTFMHRDRESNEQNNICKIAKIDLELKAVVQWSDDFHTFNHCNDIVYNPNRNILVLCHNNPNKNRISLIDPDSLTLIESFDIGVKIYSIDYSPRRDRYVVGLSGGQNLMFLDADFQPVDGVAHQATPLTKRYITQGICSDEELIYCVLWDGRMLNTSDFQGVATVYDWNGCFKGVIEYDIGVREPENLSVINDELYICAGDNGAWFFKITPKKKEK